MAMVAPRASESHAEHPRTATPNPLRNGEWVRCPRCGVEGQAWEWELKRAPYHQAFTVPVYKCRGRDCGHYFALVDAVG